MKYLVPGSLMVVGLFVFAFSGCGSGSTGTSQPASSTAPAGSEDHSGHDHGDQAGHDHGDSGKMSSMDQMGKGSPMDQMEKGLASLSPEDAAAARKQHICPVSGEMLGTMGTPIKVEVKGREVWLCCSGCKDKLLADPDKYLAKLNK